MGSSYEKKKRVTVWEEVWDADYNDISNNKTFYYPICNTLEELKEKLVSEKVALLNGAVTTNEYGSTVIRLETENMIKKTTIGIDTYYKYVGGAICE